MEWVSHIQPPKINQVLQEKARILSLRCMTKPFRKKEQHAVNSSLFVSCNSWPKTVGSVTKSATTDVRPSIRVRVKFLNSRKENCCCCCFFASLLDGWMDGRTDGRRIQVAASAVPFDDRRRRRRRSDGTGHSKKTLTRPGRDAKNENGKPRIQKKTSNKDSK